MSEIIYVGNFGHVIELTEKEDGAAVDISAATTKQIIFTKPSGATIVRTATFTTDGTDGKIRYTTVDGDIDVAGRWRFRGQIQGTGYKFDSSKASFLVATP